MKNWVCCQCDWPNRLRIQYSAPTNTFAYRNCTGLAYPGHACGHKACQYCWLRDLPPRKPERYICFDSDGEVDYHPNDLEKKEERRRKKREKREKEEKGKWKPGGSLLEEPRTLEVELRRISPSTRLRRAILTDDLLLVKRILTNHPTYLHNPDHHGATSLHLAAEHGCYSIVAYLTDQTAHEADGPSKTCSHDTPLMLAAAEGHEAVVHFLASRFVDQLDARNKSGLTALMTAAKQGRDSVVNILLDLGADVEVTDAIGSTALHYASAYGHLKVIRTLLERGAAPDRPNRQGWSALAYSFSLDAERYFLGLVAELDKRKNAAAAAAASARARAATPVFGKSERAVAPSRQRASSGS